MKRIVVALVLFWISSCQSIKIKDAEYKTSNSIVELGSVGKESSSVTARKTIESKAFPVLQNKIRLYVNIVPFTKQIAKKYSEKSKFQQSLRKLHYVDSLPVKPELVTIEIADKLGYINELNAEHNGSFLTLLQNSQKISMVSSIALYLNNEDLNKIKQADSYYLINNLEKKYTIALYKQGKKTDTIEMIPNEIIGYQTNVFCWSQTKSGRWYIADMTSKANVCKGKTFSKIKEDKKEDNLFKM